MIDEDVVLNERTDEMIELYGRGWSAKNIADELKISTSTVCRNLRKAGVKMAPRGQRYLVLPEYVEMARRMRAEGVRWIDVSAHIGFSIRQLQFHLRDG